MALPNLFLVIDDRAQGVGEAINYNLVVYYNYERKRLSQNGSRK